MSPVAVTNFFRDDLARAGEVQRSFLPVIEQDERCGVRVVAEYRPAFEVGGDFYDVVYLPDGRITALIGDVAGKGIAAALLMARVSTEFRRLATAKLEPKRILERVDEWLESQSFTDRFVTAACVQLQLARGRWVACNAGHVVPLLRRKNGDVVRLAEASGLPLGLGNMGVVPFSDPYVEEEVAVAPGDTLLLVTDGVMEALTDSVGVGLDGTPLQQLLTTSPHGGLDELRETIFQSVDQNTERRDDATLLALSLSDRALAVPAIRMAG